LNSTIFLLQVILKPPLMQDAGLKPSTSSALISHHHRAWRSRFRPGVVSIAAKPNAEIALLNPFGLFSLSLPLSRQGCFIGAALSDLWTIIHVVGVSASIRAFIAHSKMKEILKIKTVQERREKARVDHNASSCIESPAQETDSGPEASSPAFKVKRN
jgi:hypothetical protein